MADETHDRYRELVPGYAAETLDAEERRTLDSHLRTCDECRASLDDYRAIADGLSLALPAHPPPPRVRARLIADLASARPATAVRRRSLWSGWPWAAGLGLGLLLTLNLWTTLELQALERQQAALLEQMRSSQTALALIAYPEARTLPVEGEAAGSLVLNAELNTGVLFAWGLDALDAGRTYQAWLIRPDGARVSAGLFRPESGQDFISIVILPGQPLTDFTGLGVTVEPEGGSPAPSGPRVLKVDF